MNPLLVLLGAGSARRFGADKLLQPCAGQMLGKHALDAALATGLQVIWIGGARAEQVVGNACEIVPNPDAARGIGTSVALAAKLAAERGHSALLIHLADMPCVTANDLLTIAGAPAPAAARQADGRPGVPALLPARLFAALAQLDGDRGAGAILAGEPDLTLIDLSPMALLDVDTPEALARAEAVLRRS